MRRRRITWHQNVGRKFSRGPPAPLNTMVLASNPHVGFVRNFGAWISFEIASWRGFPGQSQLGLKRKTKVVVEFLG
jgi:hypothetical protein